MPLTTQQVKEIADALEHTNEALFEMYYNTDEGARICEFKRVLQMIHLQNMRLIAQLRSGEMP